MAVLQRGGSLAQAAHSIGKLESDLEEIADEEPDFDKACLQAQAQGQVVLRDRLFMNKEDPTGLIWLLENGFPSLSENNRL